MDVVTIDPSKNEFAVKVREPGVLNIEPVDDSVREP